MKAAIISLFGFLSGVPGKMRGKCWIVCVLVYIALTIQQCERAHAQTWQNFKGIRLVNNSDTSAQLAIGGSIMYNDADSTFYGYSGNPQRWRPIAIAAGDTASVTANNGLSITGTNNVQLGGSALGTDTDIPGASHNLSFGTLASPLTGLSIYNNAVGLTITPASSFYPSVILGFMNNNPSLSLANDGPLWYNDSDKNYKGYVDGNIYNFIRSQFLTDSQITFGSATNQGELSSDADFTWNSTNNSLIFGGGSTSTTNGALWYDGTYFSMYSGSAFKLLRGNLTANQISYPSAAGTITGDTDFTYSSGSNTITLGGTDITSNAGTGGWGSLSSTNTLAINTNNGTGVNAQRASTNTFYAPLGVHTLTSGTAAAGIGTGLAFYNERASGGDALAGYIQNVFTDVSATPTSKYIFSWNNASLTPTDGITFDWNTAPRISGNASGLKLNGNGGASFSLESSGAGILSGTAAVSIDFNSNGAHFTQSGGAIDITTAASKDINIAADGDAGVLAGGTATLDGGGAVSVISEGSTVDVNAATTLRLNSALYQNTVGAASFQLQTAAGNMYLQPQSGNLIITAQTGTSGSISRITIDPVANEIRVNALPTSCSGHTTGTLWNNSGVLSICP